VLVEQRDVGDGGLARAGDGLQPAVVQPMLAHADVVALGEHGVVVVHDLFGLAFARQATAIEQHGAVAYRLDRLLVVRDQ
jgi:hypothetical protein